MPDQISGGHAVVPPSVMRRAMRSRRRRRRSRGYGVLLDTGALDCRNMGDVAMLQVAVERLEALLPGVRLQVFTDDPAALARYCPTVVALPHAPREEWYAEAALLEPLRGYLSPSAWARAVRVQHLLRDAYPHVFRRLLAAKARLHGRSSAGLRALHLAQASTDLLVIVGQGSLTDEDERHARVILGQIAAVRHQRHPAVLMGQGIGPLTNPALVARARAVLPHVALCAVREGRRAPALLASLGVAADRVVVTGDDAIVLAHRMRPDALGEGLGIHVRRAPSAFTSDETLRVIRAVLFDAAARHPMTFRPLPISHHAPPSACDPDTIAQLLQGRGDPSDGGRALTSPAALIEQAGRCRVVVSGAYHAAVFALSQGVPVICLAVSEYYADKFHGLAAQFGEGCSVLDAAAPSFRADLARTLERTWHAAPALREPLLAAAVRQVAAGEAAYARIAAILGAPA